MKKFTKALAAIMLMVAVVCTAGCNKQENNNVKVTTNALQDITTTTATIRGEVEVMAEGFSLTDMGVCWGIAKNPTVSDNYLSGMNRDKSFTCTITGLEPNTKYHVRVYATDGMEFYYGSDQSFTTLEIGSGNSDNGMLRGLFSVDAVHQVHFSQGNLQYQASTNNWRFADNQWDYVGTQTPSWDGYVGGTVSGSDNSNISSTYSGWIDLFGWGTGDNPTNYSTNYSDYSTFTDWGINAISNGGNQVGQWRTLTIGEWKYILYTRGGEAGMRFAKAKLNGVNGMLLLPDGWDGSIFNLNSINSETDPFNSNLISSSNWTTILEANGVVFLPAAGTRQGTSVNCVGLHCQYRSANKNSVGVYDDYIYIDDGGGGHYEGQSVRLVCPEN